jgi:hypothetical protein
MIEQYIVRYSFLKEDGYWSRNNEITIDIDLNDFPNEKDNHMIAGSMAKEQLNLKNMKIESVTYI